jgi:hypothetical protein
LPPEGRFKKTHPPIATTMSPVTMSVVRCLLPECCLPRTLSRLSCRFPFDWAFSPTGAPQLVQKCEPDSFALPQAEHKCAIQLLLSSLYLRFVIPELFYNRDIVQSYNFRFPYFISTSSINCATVYLFSRIFPSTNPFTSVAPRGWLHPQSFNSSIPHCPHGHLKFEKISSRSTAVAIFVVPTCGNRTSENPITFSSALRASPCWMPRQR